MGGSLVYQVDERWPDPESALVAARHIVRGCATGPRCLVEWETGRLDAVAGVRPLLADAGGDAVFRAADPGPLVAALRESGLDPCPGADPAKVRAIGYAHILDA